MKFLATDQHGLTRISPIGLRPFGLEECLEPCDPGARRFVRRKKDSDFPEKSYSWDQIADQVISACRV